MRASTPRGGSRRADSESTRGRGGGCDRVAASTVAELGGPLRASIGTKRTSVAGRQLAELPPLGGDHGGGTGEPAEARAVGTEHDRGVAGEVDGAERVAGVVDVGWVQPGLAAVGSGPAWPGAVEAHPGAGAVDLHPPLGGEEGVDVGGQ